LLTMARTVLEKYTKEQKAPALEALTLPGSVQAERGCFVTLHKQGELRGCIGTILPQSSLARCVMENTVNAAAHDPRFDPVTPDELGQIKIEISVLTVPAPLVHKDTAGLLARLQPGRHGVILRQGLLGATFLPQVWEELPTKELFLSHLCRKGGMAAECWKTAETQVDVYEDTAFAEGAEK
jgi:AmmeMemoRadiSam system protein A